jgi:hypothetical protein
MGQSAETVDFPVNDRFSNEVDIEVLSKFTAALAEPRPQAHKERERERPFCSLRHGRKVHVRPFPSQRGWAARSPADPNGQRALRAGVARIQPLQPTNARNGETIAVGGRETLIGTDGHRRNQSFLGLPNLHPFYANQNSTLLSSPSPSDPPIQFFSPYQKAEPPSGLSSASALPTILVKPSHFVSLVPRYSFSFFFFSFFFFFASGSSNRRRGPALDIPSVFGFLDRRKRGAQFPPS